jgi:hypothetical protein
MLSAPLLQKPLFIDVGFLIFECMHELVKPLQGITSMLAIVCIEILIVIVAMAVDFASGYYKAKLRGEERNSQGMKRTISKFILYVGGQIIASGVDSIFYICGGWGIFHLSALSVVPVVNTIMSLFICAVEIRSVWEKAERKQKRDALQTAEAIVKLMSKDSVGERLEKVVNEIKNSE